MKAAIRSQYGNQEVLTIKEIDTPVVADDEVLVKVHVTTVNRTDCANLTGKPFIVRIFTGITGPMKAVPGTDFAGEVVEVGKDVSSFETGDRVFGFDDAGLSSMAEFMSIKANKPIRHIPSDISYRDTVASVEGAHYAINFINKVKVQVGEKAMINGGTGAIGSALIQLLKYYGVKVVATGPEDHLEKLLVLGAERVIDYRKDDFTQDNEKFDYVFDAVGKSTFAKCKNLLGIKGIYISSELGPNAENPFLAISTSFSDGKKVRFPFPQNTAESLNIMSQLLESGNYKPLIDRDYQLEQVQDAFKYVMSGEKIGNVILNIAKVE